MTSQISRNDALHEYLRRAPDCGDNSCLFGGRGKGGMRTNGGCRCFKDLPTAKRIYVERLYEAFVQSETQPMPKGVADMIANQQEPAEDMRRAAASALRGKYRDSFSPVDEFLANRSDAAPQVPEVREAPGNVPIASSPAVAASSDKNYEQLPLERLKTEAERWAAAVGSSMPITATAAKELRDIVQRAHDLGLARSAGGRSDL